MLEAGPGDGLLSSRHYFKSSSRASPEARLFMGVITAAGEDMTNGKGDDRIDATQWILSEDECFMSFNWYCDQLRLSARRMRNGVLRNIKRGTTWSRCRVARVKLTR